MQAPAPPALAAVAPRPRPCRLRVGHHQVVRARARWTGSSIVPPELGASRRCRRSGSARPSRAGRSRRAGARRRATTAARRSGARRSARRADPPAAIVASPTRHPRSSTGCSRSSFTVRGFAAGVGDEEAGRRAGRRSRRCPPLPCRTGSPAKPLPSLSARRAGRRHAAAADCTCPSDPQSSIRSATMPVGARAQPRAARRRARPIHPRERASAIDGRRAPAAATREQRRERQHERAAGQRCAPMCDARPDRGT